MNHSHKHHDSFAAWMLYAVSILGILDVLMTPRITGQYTSHIHWDISVYIALALLAFLIHMGWGFVKIIWLLVAIVWSVLMVAYLPEKTGHTFNLFIALMQLLLTIAAYVIFLTKKKS